MNAVSCPHCGQSHPAGSTFCTNTGRPLAAPPAPQRPAQPGVHGHAPGAHAPPGHPGAGPQQPFQPGPPAAPAGYGAVPPPGVAPAGYAPQYAQPPAPGYAQPASAPAAHGAPPAQPYGQHGYAPPGGQPYAQPPGYGAGPAGAQPYAQPPYAQQPGYGAGPGGAQPYAQPPGYGAAPPPAQNAIAPAGHAHLAPHGAAAPGVRHNYPLAIREAGFSTAAGLLMKTMPYALARFGVLVGVSIVTLIWYAVAFGGWAALAAHVNAGVGLAWFLVCCGVFGYFWWMVVRYFLYLLKCGHIVVLTDLITKGRIDDGGKGMFAYGKDVVRERFGEVNVLFAVDAVVSAVVRTFNRTLDFVANLLPLPGLSSIVAFVNAVIYAATTYLDETIFSYGLARQETNPWSSAKDGLIYYAQNSKEILKTGVGIVILDKVLTFVIWVVMLAPAFLVAALMPSSMGGVGFWFVFGFAALLAGNVRAAFLKPLFLVMIMTKFHVAVQNQAINQEWDERLSRASDKFRELSGKIAGYRPGPVMAPAP